MLKPKNIILLGLVPLTDLIVESFCQLSLFFAITATFKQYNKFTSFFLENTKQNFLKKFEESILNTIIHLSYHVLLIVSCFLLVLVTLNQKLRSLIIRISTPFLYFFPKFLNVSSFELFLLEIQCVCVRLVESKPIWNLFVNEASILDYTWPFFVFFICAPIEVRIKIYLEEKFKQYTPIVIGVLHAFSSFVFPIVYFLSVKLFYKLEYINIDTFHSISFYHFDTNSSHLKTLPINTLFGSFFLVQGHFSHHSKGLSEFLQFEAYKFANFSPFYFALAPFFKNLIFAMLVIYFDKNYIKIFCNNDIHHVCAHLLTEEFLNVGFSKFLFSPFYFIENRLIESHDQKIRNNLTNKNLSNYLSYQLHNHVNIHPSLFFMMFNNETNIIKRIDNLIK